MAIVDLDQTSLEYFDPSNAFDAEGLTQLTESIETRRRMRNEIEQRTLVDIRNQNLDTQRKVLEIDRDSEYARLEQEREVEIRRAAQRSELAIERALRDQESEQAQLSSREAVEKSRLNQERNITEERIKSEEDTQRREIARRRSLDETEMKMRELTEREQIALELSLEKARIEREGTQSELEIERKKLLEIAELERQIALAEKALEVTKAEAEKRRAEIVENQATETARIAQDRAIDEVQDRKGASPRSAADRQAPGFRGGRDLGRRRGRACPHHHRARHRGSPADQGSRHPAARRRPRPEDRDRRNPEGDRHRQEDAGAVVGDRRVGSRARQGHPGRGTGLHRPRARDRRAPQADRPDRRAARGRARRLAHYRRPPMPR